MKKLIIMTILCMLLFSSTAYAKDSVYSSIDISDNEYADLCKTEYAEGNNQNLDAQMANFEVMLNRVLCHYRGAKTVSEVLSRTGEFDGYNHRNAHTQTQITALENVLSGESGLSKYIRFNQATGYISQNVTSTDYVFFCTVTSYKKVGYKYMDNCVFIDGHVYGTIINAGEN